MSWSDQAWEVARRDKIRALTDAELAAELRDVAKSQNGFAYTPGSHQLVEEAARRLNKELLE